MDSDDRENTSLLPTRDVPEQVRRGVTWLSVEFEATAEEVVSVMVDAAREVRETFSDLKRVSRSLAGMLQDAASLFQLLRELRPGGLPLDELHSTATRIKLRDLIEKLGNKVPESEEPLCQLLEIAHSLKAERIEPEQFLKIVTEMRKLMNVRAAVEALGGTEDRVRAIHELGLWLEGKGVSLKEVRGFVEYHLKLQKLGFTWDSAHSLALACTRARGDGNVGARGANYLIELAKRGVVIQEELEALRKKASTLRAEISKLRTEHEMRRRAAIRAAGGSAQTGLPIRPGGL